MIFLWFSCGIGPCLGLPKLQMCRIQNRPTGALWDFQYFLQCSFVWCKYKLGYFFFVRIVFWGIYGVLIIPKWLIKVPGPIPILFGWFWELRFFCQNLDPQASQLSPRYFNKYTKNLGGGILNTYHFSYMRIRNSNIFKMVERFRHHWFLFCIRFLGNEYRFFI